MDDGRETVPVVVARGNTARRGGVGAGGYAIESISKLAEVDSAPIHARFDTIEPVIRGATSTVGISQAITRKNGGSRGREGEGEGSKNSTEGTHFEMEGLLKECKPRELRCEGGAMKKYQEY